MASVQVGAVAAPAGVTVATVAIAKDARATSAVSRRVVAPVRERRRGWAERLWAPLVPTRPRGAWFVATGARLSPSIPAYRRCTRCTRRALFYSIANPPTTTGVAHGADNGCQERVELARFDGQVGCVDHAA